MLQCFPVVNTPHNLFLPGISYGSWLHALKCHHGVIDLSDTIILQPSFSSQTQRHMQGFCWLPNAKLSAKAKLTCCQFDPIGVCINVYLAPSQCLNQRLPTTTTNILQHVCVATCQAAMSKPSDVIWQHRSGSTSAQPVACCLMAPSHYLNWF